MAETAIPVTTLNMGTVSADLPDGGGTTIATGADGGRISNVGKTEFLLIKIENGVTTPTVTIEAGDRKPAQRADLGVVSQVCANNDVRYVPVEAARHMKSDGSILVKSTTNGDVRLTVFRLNPKVN